MNTCKPHWTAYITAVATPIVTIIAAWIAFRQSQIARNKLKLDLFDKRMAVYEAVRETLGTAVRRGKLSQEEEISYFEGTRPALWLFGPEVNVYLSITLWRKITDLEHHNSMLDGASDDEHDKYVHARRETIKWLRDQYEEFDKLCAKYLALIH